MRLECLPYCPHSVQALSLCSVFGVHACVQAELAGPCAGQLCPHHACLCVPHLQGCKQVVCLPTSHAWQLPDSASAIADRQGMGSFIRPTI